MPHKAIGGHQSARMQTDNWLTPPHILEALGTFDLDPCAPAEWPREDWPRAQHCINRPEDGLAQDWKGRVWLNPPYSSQAVKWLEKLAAHDQGTALVFARTETSWFVQQVWKKAWSVLFLDGRIHFHRPDGTRASANAGAPSVLVAYGPQDSMALKHSELPGTFISEWRMRR